MMNIKKELTCKYCNQIYKDPIALACGDSICKHHIEQLVSIDSSNKFMCPVCDEENAIQSFKVNKFMQNMIENELHELKMNSSYEAALNDLKMEITKLETILQEPENYIYEEINELKRQVDLDREQLKIEIDALADGIFKQLEAFEQSLKAKYNSNVDLEYYKDLVESSKKHLLQYETFLNLFSTKVEERDEKRLKSERLANKLIFEIKTFKEKLLSNLLIKYQPKESQSQGDLFGNLEIKDINKNKQYLGIAKREFKGPHNALAVLSNGDLVSGDDNGKIKIWNIEDGLVKQTLHGHSDSICCLIAFDENCLISASADSTINVWNVGGSGNTASIRNTLKGYREHLRALVLLKNGDLASSGLDDGTVIKILSLEDGELIKTLTLNEGRILALGVLNNGDLVSGSIEGAIKIWNVDSGVVVKSLTGHTLPIQSLVVLPNGDLVSGSWDGTIKKWNIEDGTVKQTLTGHTSQISAIKVLDNGDLLSTSTDITLKIWDCVAGTVKKEIKLQAHVNSLEVLQNGDLVSASSKSIIIWG